MPKVAEAAQGENCLLGAATETEYRTLAAAAQAYGHKLITLAPCDINKSKQVNILVSDTGFPLADVVIYPTTAALGYGMEYVYSILERGRLAALGGDRLMAQPVILDVGYEAWRTKEARSGDEVADAWGPIAAARPGLGGRHRHQLAPGRRRSAGPAPSQGPGGRPQSGRRVSRREHAPGPPHGVSKSRCARSTTAVTSEMKISSRKETAMIIFSERINGMYRDVRAAIPERNKPVDSRPAGASSWPAGRTSSTSTSDPPRAIPWKTSSGWPRPSTKSPTSRFRSTAPRPTCWCRSCRG